MSASKCMPRFGHRFEACDAVANHIEQDLRSRGEQRVLSALMRDSGSIRHCMALEPSHFSHDVHGVIFAAIKQLIARDEPVSAHAIFETMCKRGGFAWCFPYLLAIQSVPALPSHVGYYACPLFDSRGA
jgi:replicative DNA helicase